MILGICKYTILIIIVALSSGCEPQIRDILREQTEAYFHRWNQHDFNHPDFANFKQDTNYVWHNEREGKGIRTVFNPDSPWKQWDVAWNGTYSYEITEIDEENLRITGKFQETTDFLKFIGMPEGLTATVTFWFGEDLRVKETLYDWSEKNRNMHDVIKPIVDWAKQNDSLRIQKIYLKNGFVPGKANADNWKLIFKKYDTALNKK